MLSHNDKLSLIYVRAVALRAGFAVEAVRLGRSSIELHAHVHGTLGGFGGLTK